MHDAASFSAPLLHWGGNVRRRSRLEEVNRLLVFTALGKEKADLVVKNATLVNVYSGEILEGIDVAVKGDRIALVGKADHTIGDKTKVIDAEGRYLCPGFLDGHVHIESSMVTVAEFARGVLPRGTTGVFIDPHEIANVLGVYGIKLMIEEAKRVPLKVFVCVPSCVPASFPEFETAGAEIGPKDVEEMMKWEEVVALGEMMNYPGVLAGDEKVFGEINATLRAGKVVEGHSDGILDEQLAAYAAAGITSCHESTRKIDGIQRVRLGMYAMIREGSAWRDLAEVIKCYTEGKIDSRRLILVTDDRHPEDIVREGHMDFVVRRAIEEGVDPVRAIQMATLNTAEHFGVERDVGGIAPGRFADMLILDSLTKVKVNTVIADGEVVARDGKLVVKIEKMEYPEDAKKTIRVKRVPEPEDFLVRTSPDREKVKVHVIGVVEGKVVTKHLIEELPVVNGVVMPSVEKDVARVAVIERHRATGNIGVGFVKGFGFKEGAVASTVAHDSHNLLVVGMNEKDMAFAARKLIEAGGGMIAVRNQEVLGLVELPIAGLMSDKSLEEVCEEVEGLERAWRALGCELISPFMTMSLLALSVLPELRITDKGLIDTVKFRRIDVIAE